MGDVCSDQEPKTLEIIRTVKENQHRKIPSTHGAFNQELTSSIVDRFRPSNRSQVVPNTRSLPLRQVIQQAPSEKKPDESSLSYALVAVPEIRQQVSAVIKKELHQKPLIASSFQGKDKSVQYIEQKQLFYEGQWLDGQPHGKGTIYYPSGTYFQGYFREGLVDSKDCLLILPDGSYYRGQMKDSYFQGNGTFTSAQGTIYKGEWFQGLPDGQGEETFPDGNSYKGAFFKGMKHGKGIFKWNDGKVYEGDFVKGKMEGTGVLSKGVELYEGQFKGNKKVGRNKLKTEYGVYSAQFVDGEIQGAGTFVWDNNTIFEGSFSKGAPHGEGIIRFPSGNTISGIWQTGKNVRVNDAINRPKSSSRIEIN